MVLLETIPLRVVLTGPESTGKTTLAEQLSNEYGAPAVPEAARAYALTKGAPLSRLDVTPIALAQQAAEDAVLELPGRMVILDTDLLSTAVYAQHYYGECPAWILDAVLRRRGDLYLLCDVDVPWVADPARDRPAQRDQLFQEFSAALRDRGFPTVLVRGSRDQRLAIARRAIDHLLVR